jgi:Domain of unknown function (DUF4157)
MEVECRRCAYGTEFADQLRVDMKLHSLDRRAFLRVGHARKGQFDLPRQSDLRKNGTSEGEDVRTHQRDTVEEKTIHGVQPSLHGRSGTQLSHELDFRAPMSVWTANPGAHAAILSRVTNGGARLAREWTLQLQKSYGNRYIQRVLALARKGEGEGEVSPEVEAAIERSRGGGQTLDAGVRRQMESAFGADFSGVRVHTGAESHSLNRAVNAIAFTTGQDIFFRNGAYDPASSSGRELLAHELTHVVQQGGRAIVQGKLVVGEPDDAYEQEADQVARSITANLDQFPASLAVGAAPSVTVHRQCACMEDTAAGEDCEECRNKKSAVLESNHSPAHIQRVHLDATGRKQFDCADYANDAKLEACLNDEDRLGPGAISPTVLKVQNGLQKDGADLGPDGADGKYGPATGKAVQAFKTKYHLGFEQYPDVGPGTMEKLDELCSNQPPKPNPNPNPQPTPKPTKCFDTIDWEAFFTQQDEDCRLQQASIDAVCNLAPNSPFNLGPDVCPKEPFEQRVEDCVAFAGFSELFMICGMPASGGPGKKEIREMYEDWKKKHPAVRTNPSPSSASTQSGTLQLARSYGSQQVQRAANLDSVVPSAAYATRSLQRQDDSGQVTMGSLSVHVQNKQNNSPIVGANVHIDEAGVSGPKTIDLKTDRNGDTVPVYLDEGNYTVTVTFWCCDPITFTAHLDAGEENFQFVGLKNCDCRVASEDNQNNDDGEGIPS